MISHVAEVAFQYNEVLCFFTVKLRAILKRKGIRVVKNFFSYLISISVISGLLMACSTTQSSSSPVVIPATTTPAAPPEEATPQEPIHLKVSVRNFISFAPFFIARDEGYFAEQGLDVELIDFSTTVSGVPIPLLVAKDIDVAGVILDTSVFNAILEGNNLKYVADRGFNDPNNCATDALFVGKPALTSRAIKTTADVKGKNFGIMSPGGSPEYILETFLAQNGLTQDDIRESLIPSPPARVEGLKNGSIDVGVLSEPWITRAQAADAGDILTTFADIVPNMSLGTIVFGPSILEDNPDAGVRFMAAYLKGVRQFNQGKTDRNVEIIANFTQLAPEDIKASCWTSFRPDGSIDEKTAMAFQKWAVEKGYANGPLELDQFWTSKFIDAAAKR